MDEVARTLASELALPDIATMTVILVRVLAAAMLGGIIGWERERKGRAARCERARRRSCAAISSSPLSSRSPSAAAR